MTVQGWRVKHRGKTKPSFVEPKSQRCMLVDLILHDNGGVTQVKRRNEHVNLNTVYNNQHVTQPIWGGKKGCRLTHGA
eukprot:15328128-Ditylum_brightwellii.AAC.1